jgi:hypothetical protein
LPKKLIKAIVKPLSMVDFILSVFRKTSREAITVFPTPFITMFPLKQCSQVKKEDRPYLLVDNERTNQPVTIANRRKIAACWSYFSSLYVS